jgi:hypothetical protein
MLNISVGGYGNNIGPGQLIVRDLRTLANWLLRLKKFRIVYQPLTPGADRQEEFRAVCELVKLHKNIVLVIDEVWRFTEPGWMPDCLQDLTYAGRHFGCTLLYTAQTTAAIAKGLLRVASRYWIFRIENGLDLKNLRVTCAVPDDVLRRIPSLPDRHFFERDERQQWFYRRPI